MPSPAKPEPSPQLPAVITAAQRRELARMFERAKQLVHAAKPDFAAAHRVLAECCTIDPGNTLFLQALLENLERAAGKTSRAWPWQVWALQRGWQAAFDERRYVDALVHGWALIAERPKEASAFLRLAAICDALDHQQTQVMLLEAAHRLDPHEAAVVSALAQALAGVGQFAAAARLRGELPAEIALLETASDSDLIAAVEHALVQAKWDVAERLLAERSGAEGANLRLRELGEAIMLGRAREKTRLAEEQANREPTPRHLQLVGEVLEEQRRIELGVAFARYERFSSEPASSWDLAQCLSRAGNFSEAIKYLMPLTGTASWKLRAFVALGENWQQLRQFERALGFYRQAIEQSNEQGNEEPESTEYALKAWYRGAVLAEALGSVDEAVSWLERLVAADSAYKDAAARLVKLRAVCDKGGFSASPGAARFSVTDGREQG